MLRAVFADDALTLLFVAEEFEFYLQFGDERKVTFDHLSDGFSALINIVIDILMRIDLIRKQKNDFSFEPAGKK